MSDQTPADDFADLYRKSYTRILLFVMRRVGNTSEAEDLAAEVFRIAWANVRQGLVMSTPWLFTTAQNVLRNHHRSVNRMARVQHAVGMDLIRQPDQGTLADAVWETLDSLPAHHRDILVLRYWDAMGAGEIASMLGLSTSAVWVRMHRARRAFRDSYAVISRSQHAH